MLVAKALSFALSPAGRVVMIGLAFVAWTAYQRHDAAAESEAEQLRIVLAETNRQLTVAQGIAEEARARADRTETELTELKDAQDDLNQSLSESGLSCDIPDDVRERLLRIR